MVLGIFAAGDSGGMPGACDSAGASAAGRTTTGLMSLRMTGVRI